MEQNKEVAEIFHNMAAIYRYLGADERFRALAYDKASRVIASLAEDIATYDQKGTLKNIPGIGESIAEKIDEYLHTGKIKKYEELKQQAPHDIMGMMEVTGFGPQSLKKIHEELGIDNKEELIKALQDGSIAKIKGFGIKKVENMLRGLKLHKTIEERMLLWDALEAGEKILTWIKEIPEVKQAELAGSLRRKKETIGDIDLLVSCAEKDRKKITARFTDAKIASRVLAKGDTKASILLKSSGRQVDLRIINENEWGSALQYFTGSKEHNVHLRTIAKEKGYKISEYGIFAVKTGKKIASRSEEDIYNALGFKIMPPEMREDRGEIELSMKRRIPELVTEKDIKGNMHMHSTWSDGAMSIEEIARYAMKNYLYEYIVMTDHSKSERIANGMNEKQLLQQLKEIEQVNKKLGKDFIKTGIEVDILPDGNLDLSEEVLSQLDWVAAAIHTNFKRDNTDRLLRACENPLVCCIAHPTGRLIGSREPYKADMEKVIEAAKATHTALEINCQPQRMDLNDTLAFRAREKGVKLVIDTDSHNLGQFAYMKLGVYTARRAWCTAGDILNTLSWKEIKRFSGLKKGSTKLNIV